MSQSWLRTCPFNIPQLLHHRLKANDKYLLTSFRQTERQTRITVLRAFHGQRGSLTVHRLTMKKNLKVLFELQVESCSYSRPILRTAAGMQQQALDYQTQKRLSPFITRVLRCKGEGDYGLLLAGIILKSNF